MESLNDPRLEEMDMNKLKQALNRQEGKIGYAVAWLLGVPLPILVLVYFLRGCS